MKRYHVKTRHDYDDLMRHLEEEGKCWGVGHKPSAFDGWSENKENTVISVHDDGSIWLSNFILYKANEFIEYVASVEKVETNKTIQPSCQHNGNIDVIKFAEENFSEDELIGFYLISILTHIKMFDKDNGTEDLDKAKFYIDKLIEMEERERIR